MADKIAITNVSKDQLFVDTKGIIYGENLAVFLGATASNRHSLDEGGEVAKFRMANRVVSGDYDSTTINNSPTADEVSFSTWTESSASIYFEDFDMPKYNDMDELRSDIVSSASQSILVHMEAEIIAGITSNVENAQMYAIPDLGSETADTNAIRSAIKSMVFKGNKMRRKTNAKMVGVPQVQINIVMGIDEVFNNIEHFKFYTSEAIEMFQTGNMSRYQVGGFTIYESTLLGESHAKGVLYQGVKFDFSKISAIMLHSEAFAHEYQMVAVKDMRSPTNGNDGYIWKYRWLQGFVRPELVNVYTKHPTGDLDTDPKKTTYKGTIRTL